MWRDQAFPEQGALDVMRLHRSVNGAQGHSQTESGKRVPSQPRNLCGEPGAYVAGACFETQQPAAASDGSSGSGQLRMKNGHDDRKFRQSEREHEGQKGGERWPRGEQVGQRSGHGEQGEQQRRGEQQRSKGDGRNTLRSGHGEQRRLWGDGGERGDRRSGRGERGEEQRREGRADRVLGQVKCYHATASATECSANRVLRHDNEVQGKPGTIVRRQVRRGAARAK